jgi:hypothetical protein
MTSANSCSVTAIVSCAHKNAHLFVLSDAKIPFISYNRRYSLQKKEQKGSRLTKILASNFVK